MTPAPSHVDGFLLVVEDEPLVALLLEDMLHEIGWDRTETASSLAEAQRLAAAPGCRGAVLDIKLVDETSLPAAALLRERGLPFLFATGLAEGPAEAAFAEVPVLVKPFDLDLLREALRSLDLLPAAQLNRG